MGTLMFAHFVIGALGSGAVVFASYAGLKGYEQLPKKIYTTKLLVAYISIGGALAVVLQSLTPEMYLPIQALTVGAAWPSALLTMAVPREAERIVAEENRKAKEFRAELG